MRLAVLTGGGDCAGLNGAIRAVVRTADHRLGKHVVGYERGWKGLAGGESVNLGVEQVRGMLTRGGTMLGTSRSDPALVAAGPQPLLDQLRRDGVDGLIAIGGDGTCITTNTLHEAGFPVVALPKTIDNDVVGTDVCIGFDTALAVATDAVDRLHTTAASHDRVMVLELMGRYAGHLAAGAGIAGAAAVVLVPEVEFDIDAISERLARRHGRGRSASIVVVAEGATPIAGTVEEVDPGVDVWGRRKLGGAGQLVGALIAERTGFSTRTTVLGHIQRGGSPTPTDRLLASRLGAKAVDVLVNGGSGCLVGVDGDELSQTPLSEIAGRSRLLGQEQIDLLTPLSTAGY